MNYKTEFKFSMKETLKSIVVLILIQFIMMIPVLNLFLYLTNDPDFKFRDLFVKIIQRREK